MTTTFEYMLIMSELHTDYGEIDYQEYIKSPEWKTKAESIKRERGYRCQLCNTSGYSKSLHAHHNTYERLGRELPDDITVLCGSCHELFHKNGGKAGRAKKMSREAFISVLADNGITTTNTDPWRYYEKGKGIIQHIINGWNSKLYDYYNAINIEILNAAIDNEMRVCFENARTSENWDGYDSEVDWREAHDYWKDYQYNPNHLCRVPKGV